ncbi:hypothetical protein cyc_07519 [Cyclospora cayetanensis]|uniref:Uncharacterized protein n=1 Tax=Cyclospora cayetanensis TaxID=88456 RepID=A0A1D3CZC4_9EIME|nr:hypothetical protein cyc_07519 [Cyclospora cayetanensis]
MQVYPDPAPPSPVENLRWLEDHLDVTYSPVCCSYNAGTTTLLLRLPNAAAFTADDGPAKSAEGSDTTLDNTPGWQCERPSERNLVDIFGRIQDIESLQRQSGSVTLSGGMLELNSTDEGAFPIPALPGCLEHIGDSVASSGHQSTTAEQSGASLTGRGLKQCDEANSLRNFINSCLMLPGSRRLSGVRRKKVCAAGDAQLAHTTEDHYTRGPQFLQWRGRFPKTAASSVSSSQKGVSGSSRWTKTGKKDIPA